MPMPGAPGPDLRRAAAVFEKTSAFRRSAVESAPDLPFILFPFAFYLSSTRPYLHPQHFFHFSLFPFNVFLFLDPQLPQAGRPVPHSSYIAPTDGRAPTSGRAAAEFEKASAFRRSAVESAS